MEQLTTKLVDNAAVVCNTLYCIGSVNIMARTIITSLRLSPDLKAQLEQAAQTLHRGKNWIIVQALQDYLTKVGDRFLIEEARRQSLIASKHTCKEIAVWEDNLDLDDWKSK